jgi:NADH-quinone oxidoreductase subunit B
MTLQKKIERDQQVGYEKPSPALVNEDGSINEYLPEREYEDISEGKAPRFEGIKPLKRTYVFERKGMPPAAQTDVGWIPKEVKKKLKEKERAEKAAQENGGAEGEVKAEAAETNGQAEGEAESGGTKQEDA